MFGLSEFIASFKEKKEVGIDPKDILPPIGAMFSDNDHPDQPTYMRVIGYKPKIYGRQELRLEYFPSSTRLLNDFSWDFIRERYTRLTPEAEAKWEKDYFADKDAYWKAKEDGYKKQAQDRVDSEANEIKKRIDDSKRKHIVIYCGNAISFEALLDYAVKKKYVIQHVSVMQNGVFVGIMSRK